TGNSNPVANANTVCQRCLGKGHFTFDCKFTRPYVSRPSRTELLEKPSLLAKLRKDGQPSIELPEEFKTKAGTANKILEDKERKRENEKGKPPKKRARKYV
ncbi:zinc knuckle-domain-containing protein, partial [Hysterangium stoloniferum]